MTKEEMIKVINKKIEDDRIKEYPVGVLNGSILVNRYVYLSVCRFVEFLQKYDFDEKTVKSVIHFCECLKLFEGQFAGQNLHLMGWQLFLLTNIYGFLKKDGTRLTRTVYVEITRKSSKSTTIGAIMLYELLRGDDAGQIYALAGSREQAHFLFDIICGLADSLDVKQQYIKQLRNEIKFNAKRSYIKVASGKASLQDGGNSSVFVVDELHAQQDDSLWSVQKTSQGTRKNALAIAITSAGNNTSSFCYEFRQTNIEILEKIKSDDSIFSLIYALEDSDDIEDESTWIKACPSLGTTVSIDFLREQYNSAKNNATLRNYVYSRQFGRWSKTICEWIEDDIIYKNMEDFDFYEVFKNQQTYLGADLSAVNDLTSIAYLTVHDDKYHFFVDYYLPLETIDNHKNSVYYRNWVDNKMLKCTPDNAIDYSYITEDIMKKKQVCKIMACGYDRYLSPQWAEEMTQKNIKMEVYPQTIASFSPATKEFERLMRNGKIVIHKNPITRWCFANVSLKEDHMSNVKPIKTAKDNKIDGVIACVEALGTYMKHKKQMPSLNVFKISAS